jgi:LPXTG-motif cell wall-anchored protein
MEIDITLFIIVILALIALSGFLIYKRNKQSEKLQKLKKSINKYFKKNEVVFQTPSGEQVSNSDRAGTLDIATN